MTVQGTHEPTEQRTATVTGGHRRRRRRSIRLRIVALLVIPLISLVAIWGFAASLTLEPALNKYRLSNVYNTLLGPSNTLTRSLVTERGVTVAYLATKNAKARQQLPAVRAATDNSVAAFRSAAQRSDAGAKLGRTFQTRLDQALRWTDQLSSARSLADSGAAIQQAVAPYDAAAASLFQVFNAMTQVDDLKVALQGRALIGIGWSEELLQREDGLITIALARRGRMSPAEHIEFVQLAAAGRAAFENAIADMTGKPLDTMVKLTQSAEFRRIDELEGQISDLQDGRLPATVRTDWKQTLPKYSALAQQLSNEAGRQVDKDARAVGDRIILRLVLAGGLGLIAVIISVLVSILFARSLSRELGGLKRAATLLAEERLPRVVARLRRGEDVDVQVEAPPLDIGTTTEVSAVGDAFTQVQRTAIETAVRESYLRKGISRVFLNLAWRNQSLLHRQLRMLDSMEREAADPEMLEDLFRLDHLTTRMRRHAEGLIILSGAPPGRGWSKPVPIDDVLRGGASEVEDYTRVDVVTSSRAALSGAVVADVIHLLAELIENATVFSPPPTEVLVRGEMVANGFAVDVVDRGIGLDPRELDDLNKRLARPPEFDLADSDRLGLFVVGRLAARHGIKVALQPSAYGGTTAVVLIPNELVVESGELGFEGPAAEEPALVAVPAQPRAWFEPRRVNPALAAGPEEAHVVVPPPEPVPTPPPPAPPAPPALPTLGTPPPSLPRRMRQAHLAPQLRGGANGEAVMEPEGDPEDRSAEESRDLMSALQTGWMRGRLDDEEPPFRRVDEGGDL